MAMLNYKLIVEYDGTRFCGWQSQIGVDTVQDELEAALRKLFQTEIRLMAAGRTDAGVHATAQVANFRTPVVFDCQILKDALNGLTRRDVVVHKIELVPERFHARFDAKARQYRYGITLQPMAIQRHCYYYCRYPVNPELMIEASSIFEGVHRFEAFARKSPKEKHYLCRVEKLEWDYCLEKGTMNLQIKANRFLHSMIRLIVGSLVDVGRGKKSIAELQGLLEGSCSTDARFKAPACGLTLEKVFY